MNENELIQMGIEVIKNNAYSRTQSISDKWKKIIKEEWFKVGYKFDCKLILPDGKPNPKCLFEVAIEDIGEIILSRSLFGDTDEEDIALDYMYENYPWTEMSDYYVEGVDKFIKDKYSFEK